MGLFDKAKGAPKAPTGEAASVEDQIAQSLATLAESQTKTIEAITQMNNANKASFAAIAANLSGGQKKDVEPAPAEPPALPSDDEFENMSQKELFEKIVARVEDVVGTHLESALRGVGERVTKTEASVQLDQAKAKFEDFDDWRAEMKAEYERLGGKVDNIEDLYHLAKARNPDKVAEMAKQAEEAKAKEESEDEEGKDENVLDMKSLFGGLPSGDSQDADTGGADASSANTRDTVASIVDRAFDNPGVRNLLSEEAMSG